MSRRAESDLFVRWVKRRGADIRSTEPEQQAEWPDIGTLEKIRERKDPKHKPISQWIVGRNQEAIELMVAVYPHMGARRQAKIREVLAQVEKRPA
jgi:hypothetical protein